MKVLPLIPATVNAHAPRMGLCGGDFFRPFRRRRSLILAAGLVLLVTGFIHSLYTGYCWLNSAEGSHCSLATLLPSTALLIAGGLLILSNARFVAARMFIYLPGLISLIAWLVAVGISQQAGLSTWLWSTLGSLVLGMIYWVVKAITSRAGYSHFSHPE